MASLIHLALTQLVTLTILVGSVTSTVAADLPPLSGSIGEWGDFNNDGLMDVLLAGTIQGVSGIPDGRFTRIYRNTGGGDFQEVAATLPQLDNAAATWGDFDNDGDLDLLLSGLADGTNGPVSVTKVYRNDGNSQFTALNAGLEGRGQGSVSWVDYDNDGDVDIFVTGLSTGTTNWASKLYRNNGNSDFSLQSVNLPGLTNGVGYWADYDNDGDADLLLADPDATHLLRNDGEGVFTSSSLSIPSQHRVISPWGDFDGDGDLDFMTSSGTHPSVIFGPDYHPSFSRNDGDGALNSYFDYSLDMWLFTASWGDIDNSGRACVVVSGWVPLIPGGGVWGSATKVYIYLGSAWQEAFTLGGWDNRAETWVDFDGDGDLDIFTTGASLTTFWTNNVALHRDFPQPPLNPASIFTALDAVTLSWQSPSNTPPTGRGLSYNVRVGHTSGSVDVVSPMADVATGRRLIQTAGNASAAHVFKLNNMPPGDYHWSVQSIGQSFTGSPFTTEGIFTVTSSPPVILTQPVDQTVFAGSNVKIFVTAIGTKPLAYQWRKDGVPVTEDEVFAGAAGSYLTISNAQPNLDGMYDVVITNSYGAITSSVATLQVEGQPRILIQPADQNVLSNRTASFSVVASGGLPLSYRWLHYGIPLLDDDQTSGTTTATVSIQNVHSGYAGVYSVVVSNAWGSITSSVVTLNMASFRYVNVNNPTPASPYLTWASAATVIQDAIDVSAPGDEIVVTNGVYQAGSVSAGQLYYASHRIALNKPLTVISVNGPEVTTIVGGSASFGRRCAYVTNGAVLAGFTLTGGRVDLGDTSGLNQRGGGVLCQSLSCIVSNCVITGNIAGRYGGGVYSGTLINCVLANNTARDIQGARTGDGGGAYNSNLRHCIVMNNSARYGGGGTILGTLTNCLIRGNSAVWGAGAYVGTLVNCTVVGNSAYDDGGLGGGGGGGVASGSHLNSIIVQNTAPYGTPNFSGGAMSYCCTSPLPGGLGNINVDPLFVDPSAGNYRLLTNSPCINAGDHSLVNFAKDLDGRPRVVEGVVDMGAFESQQLPWAVIGPLSQSVLLNSNVLFTVSTVGAPPFTYQWQKDGVNLSDDARITGVSTPALAISNLVTQDAGGYRVIVSNPFGVATSSVANLTVLLPPSVVVPPTNQSVGIGAMASFNVLAAGSPPLAYQWRKDGTNLVNGGTVSGANTELLQVANAGTNDAGSYEVAVTSPYGSATSAPALLSLLPLAINTQPASRTVLAGTNVTFTVGASGLGTIFYQWRFNQADLPGKTNPSLTLTNVQSANAGDYDMVVTNLFSALTSSVATLTVLPAAPIITTQAVSRVVSVGQNVSFTVAAKGTEPMVCRWQFNGTDLPGSSAFTLSLTDVNASFAGTYRAAVTNQAGYAFSTNVTLVVSPVLVWSTNNQQVSGNIAIPASVTNVIAITAGKVTDYGRPCFALRADGVLVSWGGFTSIPANTTNVVAISAGGLGPRGENNLALIGDGTVVHWNLVKQTVPAAITNGNLVAVAAGASHQLVLRADGTVFAWGSGGSLQTNVPPGATNVIAIAAGTDFSLALRSDGTVVVWGAKTTSQAAAFSNVLNVAAISAGGIQAIGLLESGSAFGYVVTNSGPQPPSYGPPPPNATNLTAISAGLNHSLALRTDGTVLGWGYTNLGQTTIPPHATNVLAVAAGSYHSLALVHDPFAPPIPPRIGRPPLSRSIFAGQSALLNALAVGGLPLSSQWYRNGATLAGQTNQWLAFSNVQLDDAGNYQLVVTNAFGSVTSAVAVVTVSIPQPILQSLGVDATGFRFSFQTVTGVLYVSERRDGLESGNWTELERRPGSGGLETVTDSSAGGAMRFYRVRVE